MEQPPGPSADSLKGIPRPWRWVNPATGEELDSETLITENLRLARKYAWNWARRSAMAYDELEAIAFVGLVKGCRRYDPASGYKLSTIAVPFIQGEILHHFRDRGYAVRFPSRWREMLPRAKRMLEAGSQTAAVCEAIGVSPGELEEMLNAMAGTTELNDEVMGQPDADLDSDVLQPVEQLVATAWERLHPCDQKALQAFWSAPGRRPVMPMQALGQFLNVTRMALRGQRLPEIRRQLALGLKAPETGAAEKEPPPRRPRGRSRAELQQQALQLGLIVD